MKRRRHKLLALARRCIFCAGTDWRDDRITFACENSTMRARIVGEELFVKQLGKKNKPMETTFSMPICPVGICSIQYTVA